MRHHIALSLLLCSELVSCTTICFAQDIAEFTSTVEKLPPKPVAGAKKVTTTTQVSAPTTSYQVKIQKVTNHKKYALPLSNQPTASKSAAKTPAFCVSPVLTPSVLPPASDVASPLDAADTQAAAAAANKPKCDAATLAAISKMQPVIVTDVSGPARGTGPVADSLLEEAPQLGDYRAVSISPQSFKAFIQMNHGAVHANPGEVIVFKGRWDKAEHLLDQCGIAYSDPPRSGLSEKLSHAAVAVVDCPGDLRDEQVGALRQFVLNGGYLVSTDWALDNCISKMFPGFLVWKGAYSNPETIDAVPIDRQNPLLKGLPSVAPWRLDDKSEIIELGGRGEINVLVRSRALQKEDPNNIGILAATIVVGRGKVLHMIGHFDNNDNRASSLTLPDPAPGIKISLRQSLAINFIVEALKRHQASN